MIRRNDKPYGECKRKKKCLYGKRFAGSLFYCDYLCMTGKMRPCDAENCTEFIDKKKAIDKSK